MFNLFGTRTPAQKAAAPSSQNRKQNAALAQAELQKMQKREDLLSKKVQHSERQITLLKAEAQARLKEGNKPAGKQTLPGKIFPIVLTATHCAAKAVLKRKIQAEKQLTTTLAMLDKMVIIRSQVENANTQGMVAI
jgi:hypothetical protein